MYKKHIDQYLISLNKIIKLFYSDYKQDIDKIIQTIYQAYLDDKQIFVIGNGGSASLASHFVCDLSKGSMDNRYTLNKRINAISLVDNMPTILAYANDLSYDDIFSEQLKNSIQEGDLLIAISSSGNSKNILKSVNVTKEKNAKSVGLIGFDGGELKNLVDSSIIVPSTNYGLVEDAHGVLAHIISQSLVKLLKNHE